MNHHNGSHLTARIVLAVAFLGAGIASAQTRPTLELRSAATALRTATPTNSVNRSNTFQSLNIDRAARPLDVKRIDALSGYSQPRAGEVAVCPLVAAAAVVAVVATEVMKVQESPERWMPSVLDGIPRGSFTNLGMYDR